jgi:Protein of unknown function (DUF2914)
MKTIVGLLSIFVMLGCAGVASAGAAMDNAAKAAAMDNAAKAVSVDDAAVCASIAEKAPQGAATHFPPDVGKVYAFTKVVGMEPPGFVTHRWLYKGEVAAEVKLEVHSPSWRTWSSKEILGSQTGDWKVEILDGGGTVLATLEFTVGPAGQ